MNLDLNFVNFNWRVAPLFRYFSFVFLRLWLNFGYWFLKPFSIICTETNHLNSSRKICWKTSVTVCMPCVVYSFGAMFNSIIGIVNGVKRLVNVQFQIKMPIEHNHRTGAYWTYRQWARGRESVRDVFRCQECR